MVYHACGLPMSIDDLRWFDLFHQRGTRRDFLRVAGAAGALIASGGALPARRGDAAPRFRSDPFDLGVASGDPLPHGVVLWTRLNHNSLAEVADPGSRVPVRWEIADDEAFRNRVATGDTLAIPELGHSVHAEVEGLLPGRVYYYRFVTGEPSAPSVEPAQRLAPAPPPTGCASRSAPARTTRTGTTPPSVIWHPKTSTWSYIWATTFMRVARTVVGASPRRTRGHHTRRIPPPLRPLPQ